MLTPLEALIDSQYVSVKTQVMLPIEKERVLSEEEDLILETIENAADKRYHHLKDMIEIALNTGMLQDEISEMKKGWINLQEGLIIVPRYPQK